MRSRASRKAERASSGIPEAGFDAGPCLTDIDRNPLRSHLHRPDGRGALWLWMKDYAPHVIAGFNEQHPPLKGFEDSEAMERLGILEVAARVVDRIRHPQFDQARRFTEELARPDPWPDLCLPDWDVAQLEITVRRRARASGEGREDIYTALFSPFDSEAMVRCVFQPAHLRLVSLVLLRFGGGFSKQRGGLDHHSVKFLKMVERRLGLPDHVVADQDPGKSPWTRGPFVDSGRSAVGWKSKGLGGAPWQVRLFRRRVGLADGPSISSRSAYRRGQST
jgi:hypothetical protein